MQEKLYGVWEAAHSHEGTTMQGKLNGSLGGIERTARREPRCKGSSTAVWGALSAQPGGNHDAREALRQSGRPLAHS
ncbi:hypothetical protein DPMN_168146 [Dreissena polymorpha]|uniref:Uncharacterized protein n=1 Tax=Dreissena polymorpha TaxID=45954 RepID=A0A9D4F039_DREPO|nr:hypothetical protein DPMN_168146 [Dreissena polymorpha]